MADRSKIIELFNQWRGAVKGDKIHKEIVDTYNSIKPLPYGYKLKYTDPYCAGTVSALFHKAGYDDIFPSSASCTKIIEKAKKMGIWVENDAYSPKIGDCLIYDWEDGKDYSSKDNAGAPDHIGIVIAVNGNDFTVGEGNMGATHCVGIRSMKVNGRYIRGFVCPKFDSIKEEKPKPSKVKNLTFGDEGEEVIKLHKRLMELKYGVSDKNPKFDMLTRACVIHYQTVHGLVVDGIVGEKTRKSLGL